MPFGGESYADVKAIDFIRGELAKSPVPFGGESYADLELVDDNVYRGDGSSPVPFGGESYADFNRPPLPHPRRNLVSSAFRR